MEKLSLTQVRYGACHNDLWAYGGGSPHLWNNMIQHRWMITKLGSTAM